MAVTDSGLGTDQPDNLTETGVPETQASRWSRHRQEMYLRSEVYRIGAAVGWQTTHKGRAADLIAEIYDGVGLQGKDLDTIAAALCWLVSRIFGVGLSPSEVSGPAREVDAELMLRRAMWVKRELALPMPLTPPRPPSGTISPSSGLGVNCD